MSLALYQKHCVVLVRYFLISVMLKTILLYCYDWSVLCFRKLQLSNSSYPIDGTWSPTKSPSSTSTVSLSASRLGRSRVSPHHTILCFSIIYLINLKFGLLNFIFFKLLPLSRGWNMYRLSYKRADIPARFPQGVLGVSTLHVWEHSHTAAC